MCTVSVIPPHDERGLRVAVNRDERRSRALAWAPQLTVHDDVPVLWPVDSASLGTWVAASSAGIVWTLVNLNRGGPLLPRAAGTSRGHIIPAVAGAADLADARCRFARLDLARFSPFRLLTTTPHECTIHEWDGQRVLTRQMPLRTPQLLSSSSLGDHLVERPRRELFDQLLETHSDSWRAQDHLHQHEWPDRRHLSVLMSRATARTVSRTIVTVDSGRVEMSYAPVVDGWIGPVVSLETVRGDERMERCA